MERPILFSAPMVRAILEGRKTMTRRVVKPKHLPFIDNLLKKLLGGEWGNRPLPYKKGDRLWVRETYSSTPDGHVHYRATDDALGPWRPSIFMPRWASRITLEITNVRVERLQDITEEDAKKEGVDLGGYRSMTEGIAGREHTIRFRDLWDSINGKTYPWASNPFCWVVEFRKC